MRKKQMLFEIQIPKDFFPEEIVKFCVAFGIFCTQKPGFYTSIKYKSCETLILKRFIVKYHNLWHKSGVFIHIFR